MQSSQGSTVGELRVRALAVLGASPAGVSAPVAAAPAAADPTQATPRSTRRAPLRDPVVQTIEDALRTRLTPWARHKPDFRTLVEQSYQTFANAEPSVEVASRGDAAVYGIEWAVNTARLDTQIAQQIRTLSIAKWVRLVGDVALHTRVIRDVPQYLRTRFSVPEAPVPLDNRDPPGSMRSSSPASAPAAHPERDVPGADLKPITRTHAADRVRAALVRHKRVASADVFAPGGDAGTIHIKVDTVKRTGGPGQWWGPKVRKTLGIVTVRLEGGEEDSATEIQPKPEDGTIRRAVETALRGHRVLPAPTR